MPAVAQPPIKLVADFETTVFKHQTKTEVWAAALVELHTEDVKIYNCIEDFLSYLFSLKRNLEIKFHNLKFDGSFILYSLMTKLKKKGFKHGYIEGKGFQKWKELPSRAYTYLISSMGQWYQLIIKNGRQKITITDSLKLLPFNLRKIGKDFETKHQKLEMKYEGYRFPGCEITEEEKQYIRNDVLVLKEAIEIFEAQGHKKSTIASCCLEEYKKTLNANEWDVWYPNTKNIPLNAEEYGSPNVDSYVRRSYKGGWCYYVKGKEGKIYHNGITLDVNSLYPAMMESASGNYYPVGKPKFWKGEIPQELLENNEKYKNYYYFVRIRTRFKLKEGKLPCIQIKGNKRYKATEWLDSSDFTINGKKSRYTKDRKGNITDSFVTLTLTCVDYELIKEHYDLIDCDILDGCYFRTEIGIFDTYIEKWREIKENSTGAIRAIAKLFLNSLYGKMASSDESSYKVAYINENGSLSYHIVIENEKEVGYIPVGSAITSYARAYTIRAAQANYYGVDKPGFIYADTDSIKCDLKIEDVKGVELHDTKFGCWKVETNWKDATYLRQKTYVEVEEDKYIVKCAGMPENCKKILIRSFKGEQVTKEEIENEDYTPEQIEFLKIKRDLTDFKKGLKIYGKLMPRQVPGGTLLVPGYFEIR